MRDGLWQTAADVSSGRQPENGKPGFQAALPSAASVRQQRIQRTGHRLLCIGVRRRLYRAARAADVEHAHGVAARETVNALTRAFGGQLFGVDQQKRFLLFQAA